MTHSPAAHPAASSTDLSAARNDAFYARQRAYYAAIGRRCPVFAALASWATADFRRAQEALDRAARRTPGADGLYRW